MAQAHRSSSDGLPRQPASGRQFIHEGLFLVLGKHIVGFDGTFRALQGCRHGTRLRQRRLLSMEPEHLGPAHGASSLSSGQIVPVARLGRRCFEQRLFQRAPFDLGAAPGLGMQHLQTRRRGIGFSNSPRCPLQERLQRGKPLAGGFQHIHQSGGAAGLHRSLLFQAPLLLIPAAHALFQLQQTEGERFADHTERLELKAHAMGPGIRRRQGRHGFTQQTKAWPDGIGVGRWRQISAL